MTSLVCIDYLAKNLRSIIYVLLVFMKSLCANILSDIYVLLQLTDIVLYSFEPNSNQWTTIVKRNICQSAKKRKQLHEKQHDK